LCRYVIVQLGLVGPLMQVTKTVAKEVSRGVPSVLSEGDVESFQIQRQATDRLREHFAQPVLVEPSRTRSGEDSFEDDGDEVRTRRGVM